jgi:phosphoribosylamine--glycine ligase
MLRLKSDLVPALLAARDGALGNFDLRWLDDAAVTVVMAAHGYPGKPQAGTVIGGLDAAAATRDVVVFHAGTSRDSSDRIVASGGRVLAVSATGKDVASARAKAYAAIDVIDWPGGFCRRDIANRALGRA